jgi:hypothetical protein
MIFKGAHPLMSARQLLLFGGKKRNKRLINKGKM